MATQPSVALEKSDVDLIIAALQTRYSQLKRASNAESISAIKQHYADAASACEALRGRLARPGTVLHLM